MEMQRTTFSVAFYIRRTRLNKHGESPIHLRITVNRMRADTTVKKTISPSLWDSTRGRVSSKSILGKELNLYLDAVRAKVTRIHRDMEMDGERITAQKVLDHYLGRNEKERHTILEVFREHNEKCRKLKDTDMAKATVVRYETTCRHLAEYNYQKDDVWLYEVNHEFITDFEFFLKTVRNCNHNSSTKYIKNFKKITRIALANEWIKKDPFANIKFKLNEVDRDFLEEEEIRIIMDKEIKIERLSIIRDAFIFCCFTGLAFSDVKSLNKENICKDANDTLWIRKRRTKTNIMCNIPLLDIPKQILNKYKEHPECAKKNVLLPIPTNQKMNSYLKEIADICGITKQLTTHVARHGNLYFPLKTSKLQTVFLQQVTDKKRANFCLSPHFA